MTTIQTGEVSHSKSKMKAVRYQMYGGPEVLNLVDVPVPSPKPGEVLVKVRAVSLNDWDAAMLGGDVVNRAMNGFRTPKIQILGSDIAGVVDAVGENVTRFRVGDEVYGDISGRWGGLAEFACAPETSLATKPAKMSFEEAAAIPQAGMLAFQGLIDKGDLQKGQRVLVNGAGGGVGTYAIQLAKKYDVEVTGVDNASKLDLMRSLGYHHVIDYTREDFTRNGKQYDLILDTKTNRPVAHYLRALRPGGRYVTVGGDIGRLLRTFLVSRMVSVVTGKRLVIVALKPNKDLPYFNALFEKGQLKSVMDGPYRLDEAQAAFQKFNQGLHRGKIIFRVDS